MSQMDTARTACCSHQVLPVVAISTVVNTSCAVPHTIGAEVFPVRSGGNVCTKGCDVACMLQPLSSVSGGHGYERREREGSSFANTDPQRPSARPPAGTGDAAVQVAFMDCEGFGDRTSTHDEKLAVPMLLLPSILIFNWSVHM